MSWWYALSSANKASAGRNINAWLEVTPGIIYFSLIASMCFFTSNLNYDELESALSISKGKVDSLKATRIMERIKNLTISINLIGENRRK